MHGADILSDAFGRLPELIHSAVDGLSADQLNDRIEGSANHIGWLVWHLTRVQDGHLTDAAGGRQQWTAQGWAERFGLPLSSDETGWSQSLEQVSSVRITDPALLTGYYDAVHARTLDYLVGLTDADLDRVVDENWDPPVTLGVRLVSVLDDCLEHAGQAHFVRGILENR